MRLHVVIAFVLTALAARTLVALHPHSGKDAPPMFGDYEAQRHWMELCSQLPVREWYYNGTNNNLQYWGLDYPPLTAYHSALLGKIGLHFHPQAFALGTSHGAEDAASKAFMRFTVLMSDVVTYIPAVLLFVHLVREDGRDLVFAAALSLMQPALLLIDHGHFQFNGVCLGLVAFALAGFTHGSLAGELVGSVSFVLALCFKHMALYFAPAIGVFLLSRSLHGRLPLLRIATLGLVVLATLGVVLWPLRFDVPQVLHRMFPVGRGLYEDKVANVWCTLSPVWKLKQLWSAPALFRLCAMASLAAIFPACMLIAMTPSARMLLLGAAAVSLSAFLFAFQVHEKSILMPLLPVSLLALHHPRFATWFSVVSCFSMFPLLRRDGLTIPYIAAQLVLATGGAWNVLGVLSLLPALAIHFAMAVVPPPLSLPYLWEQACTSYACGCFVFAWLFLHKTMFNKRGAL